VKNEQKCLGEEQFSMIYLYTDLKTRVIMRTKIVFKHVVPDIESYLNIIGCFLEIHDE